MRAALPSNLPSAYSVPFRFLVLFDVDGTLVLCGKQIRPLFLGALEDVFAADGIGVLRPDGYSFAGKTDPRIVLDLACAAGLSEASVVARLSRVRERYVERLDRGLDVAKVQLLPGVFELLERLTARDDVLLGLLTGNWQSGAKIKLAGHGLNRYFSFGAYGDDAVDRRDLVPVALGRAEALAGHSFARESVLVVGDSLLDVDCARAAGVRSLAVGTGFTPLPELRKAGADWVYPDLITAAREHPWLT